MDLWKTMGALQRSREHHVNHMEILVIFTSLIFVSTGWDLVGRSRDR